MPGIKKTLVCWRDIPSQVILQRGRTRARQMLSARFQEAVDRAAMRAGKGSSDAYLSEWRREAGRLDADGDLGELALEEARGIESAYTDDRLQLLIRNHGRDEE